MDGLIRNIREKLSTDAVAIILITACFVVFGMAKIALGVVPWYFIPLLFPIFFISLLRPRAGLSALVILTVLFERFFTLEGFQFGRDIVKLYPLDVVLLGLYTYAAGKLFFGKTSFRWGWPGIFLIGFFALSTIYLAASLFGFGAAEVAFSTWKNYVFYGILSLILPIVLESEDDIRMLVKRFLYAAVSAIAFLFLGVALGGGLWTEYTPLSTEGVRLVAFPHSFYFSLALLSLLVTVRFWERRNDRLLLFAVMALWSIGIVGGLMRHLWIGLFFSFAFAFVFLFDVMARRMTVRMGSIVFSSVVAILCSWLFVSFTFPSSGMSETFWSVERVVVERVVSVGDAADESIAWRGSVWQSAADILMDRPLVGTGFGMRIPVENGAYRDFVEIRNVHNSWLALFVQMGSVGFFLLVAAGLASVWRAQKTRIASEFLRSVRLALMALLLFQTVLFFAQPYLETNLLGLFFWLTIGLLCAVTIRSERTETLSAFTR